jgi:hypothetical protein
MLLIFLLDFLSLPITSLRNAFFVLDWKQFSGLARAEATSRATRILKAARMNCLVARAIKEIVGAVRHDLMTYIAGEQLLCTFLFLLIFNLVFGPGTAVAVPAFERVLAGCAKKFRQNFTQP